MPAFEVSTHWSLTAADGKQNIPYPFEIPPGITRLEVSLVYSPEIVDGFHNLVTLSVFDSAGWRGAGHRHGNRQIVMLGQGSVTPGYLPGAIMPGAWQIVLDTHTVMPGPVCEVDLKIRGDDGMLPFMAPPGPGNPPARKAGWYRGDLHSHTVHSDALWNVAGLTTFARKRGLDFVALADHNTVAGLGEMRAAAAPDLLTLGGMELTTFHGHALALGVERWIDWRSRPGHGMSEIRAEVAAQGGLFIIAHPKAPGDPYCSGCDWGHADVMPGAADGVEVWNDGWDSESNNEAGLLLAYSWLNQGHRLALTSGNDNHGEYTGRHYGFNVVYAPELSERGILGAIGRGHLYLSAGPELTLEARCGDLWAMMGDGIQPPPGTALQISCAWKHCPPGARLGLVVDGQPGETLDAPEQGATVWSIAAGSARWLHAVLRAPDGRMLAMTNPIFMGAGW